MIKVLTKGREINIILVYTEDMLNMIVELTQSTLVMHVKKAAELPLRLDD